MLSLITGFWFCCCDSQFSAINPDDSEDNAIRLDNTSGASQAMAAEALQHN
jgi:hypothetical protein